MFREPWFSIIDVCEATGRTIADIAAEVAAEHGVSLADMRSIERSHKINRARHAAYIRIYRERPDVSSGRIARYFNREGSTVRHAIRMGSVLRPRRDMKAWTPDERQRVATALRCGVAVDEIAGEFGISAGAARNRIHRDNELVRLVA